MHDSLPDIPEEWKTPPHPLHLDSQEVHVWRGILDRPTSELQDFWEVLTPLEQQRARRFVLPHHQNHFIAAHGMVRYILALYVNVPPLELQFDVGVYGKPFLACPTHKNLFFNLSHSHHLGLLAVTSLGEIGVDLEYHRPRLNYHAIADRIMSDREKSIFRELPVPQQQSAFLSCWTRKEAFVKAQGRGLGFPFHTFSVTFTSFDRPQIVTIDDHPDDAHEWSMYAMFPGEEYSGALVVQGSPNILRYWHFSDMPTFP